MIPLITKLLIVKANAGSMLQDLISQILALNQKIMQLKTRKKDNSSEKFTMIHFFCLKKRTILLETIDSDQTYQSSENRFFFTWKFFLDNFSACRLTH